MKQLILGGVRSGKSALAQRLAHAGGRAVVFVATAAPADEEMRERVARHQAERPADWTTVESPFELAGTLQRWAGPDRCLLVDCLTLWLSNLLAGGEEQLNRERYQLIESLPALDGEIILVSNEVGQGVVPVEPLARRFRDEVGMLHQALAGQCDRVILTVAGLPQVLKGEGL